MQRRGLLGSLATLALLAACQDVPPRMEETYAATGGELELVATITALDRPRRQATLRGADGTRLVVTLGPAVQNIGRLRVGDRVVLRYQQAIAAQLVQAGSPPPADGVGAAAIRATDGPRLAGAVGERVQARVTIQSVDAAQDVVTFVGPNGVPRTVRPTDRGMRDLLRTLRPGEQVDLTWEEAVAVSVTPTGR